MPEVPGNPAEVGQNDEVRKVAWPPGFSLKIKRSFISAYKVETEHAIVLPVSVLRKTKAITG